MLVILRGPHPIDLWHFDFGPPPGPPRDLEGALRWILADYPARYEEQWRFLGPVANKVLARWLGTPRPLAEVRWILTAMGMYFDDTQWKAVVPWMDHADPTIRAAAVRALGRMSVYSTIPQIARLLDDPDATVRVQAVFALRPLEDTRALAPLDAAAAKHPHLASRVADAKRVIEAGVANSDIGVARLTFNSDEHDDGLRHAIYDLWTVPEILNDKSESLEARMRAARAIGIGGHRATGRNLTRLVTDESEPIELRASATRALGWVGTSRAASFLMPFVGQPERQLEEAAIEAIGRIRDERAFLPILARWDAHGGALRPRIHAALRRMCQEPGSDVLSARTAWEYHGIPEFYVFENQTTLHRGFRHDLVRAELSNPDARARKDAAVLLSYFGDASDKPRLENMYRNDAETELRWVGAIGVREMTRRGL